MVKEDLVKLAQSIKLKLGLENKPDKAPAVPEATDLAEEVPEANPAPQAEMPKDELNIAGLKEVPGISELEDGPFSLTGTVSAGVITWDAIADKSVAATEMAEQKSKDAKILELEASLKDKDAKILTLSNDGKDSGIAQAPVPVASKPQTRAEQLIENI